MTWKPVNQGFADDAEDIVDTPSKIKKSQTTTVSLHSTDYLTTYKIIDSYITGKNILIRIVTLNLL